MRSVDHLVMGRRTYEKVLTFGEWPYSSKHVVVLSSTLPIGGDVHVTVVRTLPQVVQLLGDRKSKGVYVDGGQTIQSFLREGLIDEITLSRVPVMLGGGIPLFGELAHDVLLTQTGTSTGNSGMITSRYLVRR